MKIEIKSIAGELLFEYDCESNTILKTVLKAIDTRANLSGACLSGANLTRATLTRATLTRACLPNANLLGVNLFGATLTRVDFSDSNLFGADFSGADLSGANLTRATITRAKFFGTNLSGVDFSGANLKDDNGDEIKIKKCRYFSGLYKYVCASIVSENDKKYIKLGCHTRLLSEWNSDFWNNEDEFPNDGSEKSQLRELAFETCKKWFEII